MTTRDGRRAPGSLEAEVMTALWQGWAVPRDLLGDRP
jgi:hypothetical protein